MDEQHENGLELFAEWLAGMNLVSTAERTLGIACMVLGGLVLLAMLFNIGWWQALMLGAGHALAYLVVLNAAPRLWTWRLLGLIVLSLTHVFAFVLLSVPGMSIVALIYLVFGLALLVCYYRSLGSANKRLAKARSNTTRDDFQWIITTAPLIVRMRLHRLVHSKGDVEIN